jgi:Serine dehydrogenase proteinase
MATPPVPPNVPTNDPAAKVQGTPIFMAVLNELNVNMDQFQKRQKLINEIGHSRTIMHTSDIPHLETVLNSISGADQINLLLHSPGGDGTIVEKMVDMCRAHLSGQNRKLRVIVPNIAKSAATVLALGADQILMGYCSELGPIDPQVPIAVSGMTQWVSAFAFVEARDKLMEQINVALSKNEPTVGLLQQLAGLNIPFTDEMENQIGFAKKTAITLLEKYMLNPSFSDASERAAKASEIAEKLLSKQLFPVHGQYIDGATAKKLGLEVEVLDKDDALWKLIWDYYIRCEVQMNIPLAPGFIKTKLFESGNQVSLIAQDTP